MIPFSFSSSSVTFTQDIQFFDGRADLRARFPRRKSSVIQTKYIIFREQRLVMFTFRRGAAFAVDIDNRIFHYRIILLTLMSSVFLLAFLLFQLEQTLLFGFLLFAGTLFAFELVFLILLLQRLL